jgi:endonuclease/exonuclease/phosphatase family metal-dependent hydrolase
VTRRSLRLLALAAAACLLPLAACQQPPSESPPRTAPAGWAPAGEELPGSRGPVSEATTIGALEVRPLVYTTTGTRLATFNVEFLFDGVEPEGAADFPWKGDPEAARNHRDGVAAIIRMLDADVLMLQEVESLEVLEMMIDESLSDMGYTPYFVQGRDTFTRQDIGLLSRLPVEEVGRTDERSDVDGERADYGVSKNLWARMDIGGVPTTLISFHFLAQASNPERAPRREAQARVIRDLANQEIASGREVVMLGDLNDFDDRVRDRNNSEPVTRVMSIVKEAGAGMENVIGRVPREHRFTNFWDRNRNGTIEEGELSAIDHILLSPRLFEHLLEVNYVHAHDPTYGPDHFPIVVTLDL